MMAKNKKVSPLAKALLETAGDMQKVGLMEWATHGKITQRHLVSGSSNVFRDFAMPNADLEQARAILAAKIIGVPDDRKLSVRAAEKLTGIAASEFSRIRSVKLGRFTLDRMITILGKLDQDMEVTIDVKPRGLAHLVHA
jgi:predicted XRE-type DNA-binding protein